MRVSVLSYFPVGQAGVSRIVELLEDRRQIMNTSKCAANRWTGSQEYVC